VKLYHPSPERNLNDKIRELIKEIDIDAYSATAIVSGIIGLIILMDTMLGLAILQDSQIINRLLLGLGLLGVAVIIYQSSRSNRSRKQ
jgi:hypothetical protein